MSGCCTRTEAVMPAIFAIILAIVSMALQESNAARDDDECAFEENKLCGCTSHMESAFCWFNECTCEFSDTCGPERVGSDANYCTLANEVRGASRWGLAKDVAGSQATEGKNLAASVSALVAGTPAELGIVTHRYEVQKENALECRYNNYKQVLKESCSIKLSDEVKNAFKTPNAVYNKRQIEIGDDTVDKLNSLFKSIGKLHSTKTSFLPAEWVKASKVRCLDMLRYVMFFNVHVNIYTAFPSWFRFSTQVNMPFFKKMMGEMQNFAQFIDKEAEMDDDGYSDVIRTQKDSSPEQVAQAFARKGAAKRNCGPDNPDLEATLEQLLRSSCTQRGASSEGTCNAVSGNYYAAAATSAFARAKELEMNRTKLFNVCSGTCPPGTWCQCGAVIDINKVLAVHLGIFAAGNVATQVFFLTAFGFSPAGFAAAAMFPDTLIELSLMMIYTTAESLKNYRCSCVPKPCVIKKEGGKHTCLLAEKDVQNDPNPYSNLVESEEHPFPGLACVYSPASSFSMDWAENTVKNWAGTLDDARRGLGEVWHLAWGSPNADDHKPKTSARDMASQALTKVRQVTQSPYNLGEYTSASCLYTSVSMDVCRSKRERGSQKAYKGHVTSENYPEGQDYVHCPPDDLASLKNAAWNK